MIKNLHSRIRIVEKFNSNGENNFSDVIKKENCIADSDKDKGNGLTSDQINCPYKSCNFSTLKYFDYISHLNEIHEKYPCTQCSFRGESFNVLRDHLSNAHNVQMSKKNYKKYQRFGCKEMKVVVDKKEASEKIVNEDQPNDDTKEDDPNCVNPISVKSADDINLENGFEIGEKIADVPFRRNLRRQVLRKNMVEGKVQIIGDIDSPIITRHSVVKYGAMKDRRSSRFFRRQLNYDGIVAPKRKKSCDADNDVSFDECSSVTSKTESSKSEVSTKSRNSLFSVKSSKSGKSDDVVTSCQPEVLVVDVDVYPEVCSTPKNKLSADATSSEANFSTKTKPFANATSAENNLSSSAEAFPYSLRVKRKSENIAFKENESLNIHPDKSRRADSLSAAKICGHGVEVPSREAKKDLAKPTSLLVENSLVKPCGKAEIAASSTPETKLSINSSANHANLSPIAKAFPYSLRVKRKIEHIQFKEKSFVSHSEKSGKDDSFPSAKTNAGLADVSSDEAKSEFIKENESDPIFKKYKLEQNAIKVTKIKDVINSENSELKKKSGKFKGYSLIRSGQKETANNSVTFTKVPTSGTPSSLSCMGNKTGYIGKKPTVTKIQQDLLLMKRLNELVQNNSIQLVKSGHNEPKQVVDSCAKPSSIPPIDPGNPKKECLRFSENKSMLAQKKITGSNAPLEISFKRDKKGKFVQKGSKIKHANEDSCKNKTKKSVNDFPSTAHHLYTVEEPVDNEDAQKEVLETLTYCESKKEEKDASIRTYLKKNLKTRRDDQQEVIFEGDDSVHEMRSNESSFIKGSYEVENFEGFSSGIIEKSKGDVEENEKTADVEIEKEGKTFDKEMEINVSVTKDKDLNFVDDVVLDENNFQDSKEGIKNQKSADFLEINDDNVKIESEIKVEMHSVLNGNVEDEVVVNKSFLVNGEIQELNKEVCSNESTTSVKSEPNLVASENVENEVQGEVSAIDKYLQKLKEEIENDESNDNKMDVDVTIEDAEETSGNFDLHESSGLSLSKDTECSTESVDRINVKPERNELKVSINGIKGVLLEDGDENGAKVLVELVNNLVATDRKQGIYAEDEYGTVYYLTLDDDNEQNRSLDEDFDPNSVFEGEEIVIDDNTTIDHSKKPSSSIDNKDNDATQVNKIVKATPNDKENIESCMKAVNIFGLKQKLNQLMNKE